MKNEKWKKNEKKKENICIKNRRSREEVKETEQKQKENDFHESASDATIERFNIFFLMIEWWSTW